MRLYWELVKLSVQRALTYRAAVLAGLATNLFWGLLRVAVMAALYGARQQVAGLSLHDAITFTGLTQALLSFLWLFGWWDLMKTVDSGDIASDLLRSIDVFGFWLAREFGRSAVNLLLRGVPIMAAYAALFGIALPSGPGAWLALAVAMGLAFFISFCWRFLVNLTAFWTPNALGVGRFAFTISLFLSGMLMPLRLLPDWFNALCHLTPFPSMMNTVTEVYLGLLSGPDLLRALAWQAAWAVILAAACAGMLRAGLRRLVVQGG